MLNILTLPIYKRKGSRSVPSSYNTITIQRNLIDIHGILSFTSHSPSFIISKYFIEKLCGRISPFRKYVFYKYARRVYALYM